jgi:hypothetical protein
MAAMPKKKPVSIEIEEEAERRYVVSTYDDGTVTREPVRDKKATKRPVRPHRKMDLDHGRKRGF